MSAPVDVLAVLENAANVVSAGLGHLPVGERTADELGLARDAVAELIEEAKKPGVAYGCLCSSGIHFVSDNRDDCVEESRRDGSLVVELIVRPFSLARFKASGA